MKVRLFLIILALCLLSSFLYAQEITVQDGVKNIYNDAPKWGEKPKIELVYSGKLGEIQANDSAYEFGRPFDITVYNNMLYVVDYYNHCVKIFDLNFKYIGKFGVQGFGPGEMNNPSGIDIKNNKIYIKNVDSRFVVYDMDWNCLKTFNERMIGRIFRITRDDNIITNNMGYRINRDHVLCVYNSAGEVERTFADAKIYKNYNETFQYKLKQSGNRAWFDIDENDNIYITFLYQNRIEKYSSDGTLLFRASRKLSFKPSFTILTDEYSSLPNFNTILTCLAYDHKGRFWVITALFDKVHQEENCKDLVFEIYSNEGILLTKVEFPKEWHITDNSRFKIFGDYLYAVDPFFKACLYKYKIIEK